MVNINNDTPGPHLTWLGNTDSSSADDIYSLGVLLYEMACLIPSLSLRHRIEPLKHFPELPKHKYSREFKELLDFVTEPNTFKRPTVIQILNHPYVYPFYFQHTGEIQSLAADAFIRNKKVKISNSLQTNQPNFIPSRAYLASFTLKNISKFRMIALMYRVGIIGDICSLTFKFQDKKTVLISPPRNTYKEEPNRNQLIPQEKKGAKLVFKTYKINEDQDYLQSIQWVMDSGEIMFNIAPTYKITQDVSTVQLEATDHIIGVEVAATELQPV